MRSIDDLNCVVFSFFFFNLILFYFIASIVTISMAIGCILAGVTMEKYGRRPLFLIMNVLFFIGWMIFCLSSEIFGLLLGRLVTGFCVGLLSPPVSVYISEITQPSLRGLFLSAQGFTSSFGILMSHALGIFFHWKIVACICSLMPVLCFILIAIVPESPSWLLEKGRMEKSIKSFTWFRGRNVDSMDEYEKLVDRQKLAKLQNEPFQFRNTLTLVRSKSFYKPLSILLIYIATLQSCGPNVIAFYTITILRNSLGDNMNEYVATILLDSARVSASVFCCIIVKSIGRRPLTTFSGIATATTLLGLSAYLYYASTEDQMKSQWCIPLTLFVLYIVFITIGLQPLSWTLKGELFPLRYRSAGSTLATFFNFAIVFICLKSTPALFLAFGEHGVFLLFGISCLIGTIVLTIYLPETRNKTLQEIEDSYETNNTEIKTQNQ